MKAASSFVAVLLAVTGPPREGMASAAAQLRRGATAGENEPFGQRPPAFGEGTLPLSADRWVFTHIPSTAGGERGIAVDVLFPRQPRYTNGTAVAMHVADGVQAGGARGRPEYVGLGFVEIHFAFPVGGQGESSPNRARAIWPPAPVSRPEGHPLPLQREEREEEGALAPASLE